MCEHSLFVTCNHAPLDASGSVGIRTMRQKLTDLLRAPDYVISELLFNSIQLNNIWFVLGLTIGIATVQLDRNLDVDLDRKWANQMWKQVCMRKGTRPLLGINMQGLMFNALSKWRIVISGANRDQWPNIIISDSMYIQHSMMNKASLCDVAVKLRWLLLTAPEWHCVTVLLCGKEQSTLFTLSAVSLSCVLPAHWFQ